MTYHRNISYRNHRGFSSGLFVILILFIAAAAGFAWVSMGIVAKDRWPIRWLELNGNFQRVSAEQLRASLTPLIESSFFTLDLHKLKDVSLRHSWVSRVEVRKRWPDTVVVDVEEFMPVAHWNRGQLISSKGRRFSVPQADAIHGLPWLGGPESRLDNVLEHWTLYNEELASVGLEISQLRLDPRGAWAMQLTNGTEIKLGRQEVLARLQRLMQSWDELLTDRPGPPAIVDLRYTNGFAVRWLQESEKLAGNDL